VNTFLQTTNANLVLMSAVPVLKISKPKAVSTAQLALKSDGGMLRPHLVM
jgi:hypothetical protein